MFNAFYAYKSDHLWVSYLLYKHATLANQNFLKSSENRIDFIFFQKFIMLKKTSQKLRRFFEKVL